MKEQVDIIKKALLDLECLYLQKQAENTVMPNSEHFIELRSVFSLSLRKVSKDTGVSTSTISRIENGKEAYYSQYVKLWKYYKNLHFIKTKKINP